jgi:FixJ family two-component response regulator
MAATPVYLVDDDRAILDSTQFLLDSVGIPSTCFADPYAFLHAAPSLPPGCVLTDVRMPSMGGLELHGALARRGIGWPFVLMTGHSDIVSEAAADGVVAVIEKPFTLEKLLTVLKGAFAMLDQGPPEAAAEA